MVAGHLRVQNGYWQMIFSYKDVSGKRKTKSVSTKLKQKGNKKRAEQEFQNEIIRFLRGGMFMHNQQRSLCTLFCCLSQYFIA